jgi:four helix bundle protein
MATINKFEDLEIWQIARVICKQIEPYAQSGIANKNYSIADQIRRSSGSVMDNIAEGFEREGKKEFIQFLSISKGSAGECRSQLYRVLDLNLIDQNEFDEILQILFNLSTKIRNFIQYLNKSNFPGQKYRLNQ